MAAFWKGERCEECGGPIVEKTVDLFRRHRGKSMLIERVPAGVCTERGTRRYAADVLKSIGRRFADAGRQSGKSLLQCTRCEGAPHVVVAFGMRRTPAQVTRWVLFCVYSERVHAVNA